MYACTGCGGQLRYDIAAGGLKCDYCGNDFAIGDLEDESLHKGEYEANVFQCPQCGGEIITQDRDLTGCCSYCGTTHVFSSRVEMIRRPRWIIPFRQSQEACRKIYEAAAKKAFFAPKELRDPQYPDRIRGVYMPYWLYEGSYDMPLSLTGVKKSNVKLTNTHVTVRRGQIDADFHAKFFGMEQDASSWYWDEISDSVRPFWMDPKIKGMVEFDPAYLCGFGGETADVEAPDKKEKAKYEAEVTKKAEHFVFHKWDSSYGMEYGFEKVRKIGRSGFELGLFPVWFLSYNKGDRVSYSVINGQNGKLTAEFPIDLRKFLLCTAALAAALFALLNLFWIMRPEYVAMAAAFGAAWAVRFACRDLTEILRKECDMLHPARRVGLQKPDRVQVKLNRWQMILPALIAVLILAENLGFIDRHPRGLLTWIPILLTGWALVSSGVVLYRYYKNTGEIWERIGAKAFPAHLPAFLSIAAAMIVQILRPVDDLMYFGVGYACMVMTLISLIGLILSHNRMASRRMPQFDHEGGDGHA